MRNDALHILVVGGSGMLSGLCRSLAASRNIVTVVARDEEKLENLAAAVVASPGQIVPLSLDYRDAMEFGNRLERTVLEHGRFDLAVCWIHSDSPEAALRVADAIGDAEFPADYFHLLGSSYADPERVDEGVTTLLSKRRDIRYHPILLGFKIEGGHSRWLTDTEICDGVLAAIRQRADRSIIGTVTPWDRRP